MEIAQAACGNTGCATASEEDISILITALRSEVDVVRDAALRGLLELKNVLDTNSKPLVRIYVFCESKSEINLSFLLDSPTLGYEVRPVG